jgi:hypothetical protein
MLTMGNSWNYGKEMKFFKKKFRKKRNQKMVVDNFLRILTTSLGGKFLCGRIFVKNYVKRELLFGFFCRVGADQGMPNLV